VVLFDEMEKAHGDVFNVLLQILDDGRVTDSQVGLDTTFLHVIVVRQNTVQLMTASRVHVTNRVTPTSDTHECQPYSQGRLISFKNTILIMTSNIGSQFVLDGINSDDPYAAARRRDAVMGAVRGHFRPEFVNRVDEYIVFDPLNFAQVKKIVVQQIHRVRLRMADRKIGLKAGLYKLNPVVTLSSFKAPGFNP
jgi:ATP-dependent Clp protease ATP-binding subunit ClpB